MRVLLGSDTPWNPRSSQFQDHVLQLCCVSRFKCHKHDVSRQNTLVFYSGHLKFQTFAAKNIADLRDRCLDACIEQTVRFVVGFSFQIMTQKPLLQTKHHCYVHPQTSTIATEKIFFEEKILWCFSFFNYTLFFTCSLAAGLRPDYYLLANIDF